MNTRTAKTMRRKGFRKLNMPKGGVPKGIGNSIKKAGAIKMPKIQSYKPNTTFPY